MSGSNGLTSFSTSYSKLRIILVLIPVLFGLHLIFNAASRDDYSIKSTLSKLPASEKLKSFAHWNDNSFDDTSSLVDAVTVSRANATLLMLCRNGEISGVVESVRQLEDRFNKRYHYTWIFLNDEPFDEEFKTRVSVLASGPVKFGLISPEHWKQPDWIDEEKAEASRANMTSQRVPYADSVAYRNMCRWNSGFFYKHELLLPYRYYWRIEYAYPSNCYFKLTIAPRPNVKYYCDLYYDPFLFMRQNNKTYGFTISLVEVPASVPTLWDSVKEFMTLYPQYLHPNNTITFVSDNGGQTYNHCHWWSNFEIADMDFYRGEAYTKFFEFLELKGGFYYERWGDAPVHSIAVSLFTAKKQVHYFRDIGYKHDSFGHCPGGTEWATGRCTCEPNQSFNHGAHSCTWGWENLVH